MVIDKMIKVNVKDMSLLQSETLITNGESYCHRYYIVTLLV